MSDDIELYRLLNEELAQQKTNMARLELKASQYGVGHAPLELDNQIADTEERIQELENEIDDLAGKLKDEGIDVNDIDDDYDRRVPEASLPVSKSVKQVEDRKRWLGNPVALWGAIIVGAIIILALIQFVPNLLRDEPSPAVSPTTAISVNADSEPADSEPADSPTPTDEPTVTPTSTPIPTPAFISYFVYDPEDPDFGFPIEPIELTYEEGILPSETITDFVKLSRVAMGELEEKQTEGFRMDVVVKNIDSIPMMLDIDERFFSLEDELGQSAKMVYFVAQHKERCLHLDNNANSRSYSRQCQAGLVKVAPVLHSSRCKVYFLSPMLLGISPCR